MPVQHFDFSGVVSGAARTPQGGLRIPANLTRTGVFIYRRADGGERRELRHPDEVFSPASLATLPGAPVTIGHPGMVDSSNWKSVSVGHVGDEVRKDSKFVSASVVVQDAAAVAKVDARELVELSCGYECDVEPESGTYQGEKYDFVQKNIRYNHVGLGPKGWGRAGPDVALRLDGMGEVLESKEVLDSYTSGMDEDFKKLLAQVAKLEADLKGVTSRADSLEGENDGLKKKVADLSTVAAPEHLDSLVNARLALHESARKVLGPEAKLDGLSDRAVMESVVKTADPECRFDGRSDDYLRGRFEAAVSGFAASQKKLADLNKTASGAREDSGEDPIAEARKKMAERNANAWKGGSK